MFRGPQNNRLERTAPVKFGAPPLNRVFDGREMRGEIMGENVTSRVARSSLALSGLIAAIISTGCDPLCLARGRIVDPEGLVGARCTVRLHHTAKEPEKYGAPCRQPAILEGDPGECPARC
jgi:hypothetical protein